MLWHERVVNNVWAKICILEASYWVHYISSQTHWNMHIIWVPSLHGHYFREISLFRVLCLHALRSIQVYCPHISFYCGSFSRGFSVPEYVNSVVVSSTSAGVHNLPRSQHISLSCFNCAVVLVINCNVSILRASRCEALRTFFEVLLYVLSFNTVFHETVHVGQR